MPPKIQTTDYRLIYILTELNMLRENGNAIHIPKVQLWHYAILKLQADESAHVGVELEIDNHFVPVSYSEGCNALIDYTSTLIAELSGKTDTNGTIQ